ncbi:uncharacterized protein LOC103702970 [Phoenix dactylifera]|uniref:Uncharacterized protein LOC103702970 n=1 Tax=Phoenix dactylifera TaxID=42345 RepID=A0A8B7BRH2_PHODC|nr:uncharacterized protein LOC103702970 [Phoenix dactylifera]
MLLQPEVRTRRGGRIFSTEIYIKEGKKMGRPRFLALLLVSALVFLSFSQGYGRRIRVMRHYGRWGSSAPVVHEENSGMEREMVETKMDYQEPGANTNTRGATVFNSPPPTF